MTEEKVRTQAQKWTEVLRGLCNVRCHEAMVREVENAELLASYSQALSEIQPPKEEEITVVHFATRSCVLPLMISDHLKGSTVRSYTKNLTECEYSKSIIEANSKAKQIEVSLCDEFPTSSSKTPFLAVAAIDDIRTLGNGVIDALLRVKSQNVLPRTAKICACGIDLSATFNYQGLSISCSAFASSEGLLSIWPFETANKNCIKRLTSPFVVGQFNFTGKGEDNKPEVQISKHELHVIESGRLCAFQVWVETDLSNSNPSKKDGPIFIQWVQKQQQNDENEVLVSQNELIHIEISLTSFRASFKILDNEGHKLTKEHQKRYPISLWHSMNQLFDSNRIDPFIHGIRRAISRLNSSLNGKTPLVLDVGSGAGFFAMIAAKAGAKVISLVTSDQMLAARQEILEQNNLKDKITLLQKSAKDLSIGNLPSQPDAIIFDIFDHTLIGDEAGSIIFDFHEKQLITQTTELIPFGATIFGTFVQVPIYENVQGRYNLSDLTSFRRIFSEVSWEGISLLNGNFKTLTPISRFFSYTFGKKNSIQMKDLPTNRSLITVEQSGQANAIIWWFHLHMDSEVSINSLLTSSWNQAIQYFGEPLNAEMREKIETYCWVAGQTRQLFAFRRTKDGQNAEPSGPAGGNIPETSIPEWAKRLPMMNSSVLDICAKYGFLQGKQMEQDDMFALMNVVEIAPQLGIDAEVAQITLQRSTAH